MSESMSSESMSSESMSSESMSSESMSSDGAPTDPYAPRSGRPEAAAAIWDWAHATDDRPARAARHRKAALVRALVAGLAGGAFFYFERPLVATLAWSLGGLGLLLALVSPLGAYARLDRGVAAAGRAIGTALTWLLLTPVYFLFFAPFGWLLRRGPRDRLRRAYAPDAPTYWQKRERARSIDKPY
ncbi:MAG: hypothetical protein KF729_26510 [Sandaracinaceae bacterium]|nr:hypothetical protein [Sandaracinaceae bacterium]